MAKLSELDNELLNAVSKIEDEDNFLMGVLAFSKTEEKKREIISGVNNGTLKTPDDILELI